MMRCWQPLMPSISATIFPMVFPTVHRRTGVFGRITQTHKRRF